MGSSDNFAIQAAAIPRVSDIFTLAYWFGHFLKLMQFCICRIAEIPSVPGKMPFGMYWAQANFYHCCGKVAPKNVAQFE